MPSSLPVTVWAVEVIHQDAGLPRLETGKQSIIGHVAFNGCNGDIVLVHDAVIGIIRIPGSLGVTSLPIVGLVAWIGTLFKSFGQDLNPLAAQAHPAGFHKRQIGEIDIQKGPRGQTAGFNFPAKSGDETGRVLLTRDTRLVQCRGVGSHVLVRYDGWEDQLRQVAGALSLNVCPERMLTRCLLCNRPLEKLAPEEAYGRIPDHVAGTTSAFRACKSCDKVYWAGTHRKRMEEVVSMIRSDRKGGQEPPMG